MLRAPRAMARPTGMESTRPPSKKCSPSTSTGGSSPGTAQDASTAGTIGPLLNQRDDRPAAEPARAGPLDAGGDALKGQLKVGEVARGQHLLQRAPQRLDRMQMRARAGQPEHAAP